MSSPVANKPVPRRWRLARITRPPYAGALVWVRLITNVTFNGEHLKIDLADAELLDDESEKPANVPFDRFERDALGAASAEVL